MKYKIGDKVKIISLEKVRSYKPSDEGYQIGEVWWNPKMDSLAETMQTIDVMDVENFGVKDHV